MLYFSNVSKRVSRAIKLKQQSSLVTLYILSEFCWIFLVYSTAGEVIGLLNDYLFSELPLDIENVHNGATTLFHLKRTLGTACQGLNRLVSSCFYC